MIVSPIRLLDVIGDPTKINNFNIKDNLNRVSHNSKKVLIECRFGEQLSVVRSQNTVDLYLKGCYQKITAINENITDVQYIDILENTNTQKKCMELDTFALPISLNTKTDQEHSQKLKNTVDEKILQGSLNFHNNCKYEFSISKEDVDYINPNRSVLVMIDESILASLDDILNMTEPLIIKNLEKKVDNNLKADKKKVEKKAYAHTKMWILWTLLGCIIVFMIIMAFIAEKI